MGATLGYIFYILFYTQTSDRYNTDTPRKTEIQRTTGTAQIFYAICYFMENVIFISNNASGLFIMSYSLFHVLWGHFFSFV